MCPICWATALASFGGLLAISVVTLAATDFWTVALAALLGATSVVHRLEYVQFPWWVFATLGAATIVRLVYLVFFNRDRLLVVRVWVHACRIAAQRCPSRES